MSSQSHSRGHRRRSRRGRIQMVMLVCVIGLVVFVVAGLIWLLSNPQLSTVK
ncbi:MAG TPA: hypothetical protein VFZ59_11600 [Verrucomicrobiae bacterium]|nr:hypothetical protein [Verrucomicrobiae bacterium]